MNKFNIQQLEKYISFSKFTRENHTEADLSIYGYDNRKPGKPIIWDNINTHLRGIILDSDGNVISRSFKKFHTFKEYVTKSSILLTEGQTIRLPDCKYRIYEKVDGSMAILYWVNDKPYLASQRSFISPTATKANEILHKKYSHTFNKLNKKYTYIFEAIYPDTQVIVNYKIVEDIILIGVIDSTSGRELPVSDWGFPVAKDFTHQFKHITDLEKLCSLNLPNIEGFVLHYENGAKIKLKFPWYSEAKRLQTNILVHNRIVYESKLKLSRLMGSNEKKFSNYDIWECLKLGKPLESILINIPEEYYTLGFEFWFRDIVDGLKKQYESIEKSLKSNNDISWDKIKPIELDVFEPSDRDSNPKYCTPMWNLMKRVNDSFL